MSMLRVFKSNIPSINYIFPWGTVAAFQQGYYRTDDEREVEHLNAEVKLRHPHIFVDENEREVDSKLVDPMEALKAKIIADFLVAQEKANDPSNDMGSSDQSAVKPANSRDVAVAMAGGSGGPTLIPGLLAAAKHKA